MTLTKLIFRAPMDILTVVSGIKFSEILIFFQLNYSKSHNVIYFKIINPKASYLMNIMQCKKITHV